MGLRRMTQGGKWAQRLVGGALVLVLAGPFAPATTRAEVIEVTGEAPWFPPSGGGHTGDPGGGGVFTPSEGTGGGGGGGDTVPSGGGTNANAERLQRIAAAKSECIDGLNGAWTRAAFNDIETNIRYSGYSCKFTLANGTIKSLYYDSNGRLNQTCTGDSAVRICEPL